MKYPTPKQVRFHYARMTRLHLALQKALNDAHNAGVIQYADGKFHEESPCSTHYQTDTRIDLTTEKALAKAMRQEITKENWR